VSEKTCKKPDPHSFISYVAVEI